MNDKNLYKRKGVPNVKDPQSLLKKNSLFLLNFIRIR